MEAGKRPLEGLGAIAEWLIPRLAFDFVPLLFEKYLCCSRQAFECIHQLRLAPRVCVVRNFFNQLLDCLVVFAKWIEAQPNDMAKAIHLLEQFAFSCFTFHLAV